MNYIKLTAEDNTTVKKLLKTQGFSTRSIKEISDEGYLLNDRKAYKNKDLSKADVISVPIVEEDLDYEPIKGDLKIVYEDSHILVVDKPANLTVNSKGQVSLANHLAYYFKEHDIKAKVRLVNRLDMNTSGLLMVAKNKYAFAHYQKELEEGRFIKKYLAEVEGKLLIDKEVRVKLSYNQETKSYDVADAGKEAVTYFKTLSYDEANNTSKIICDIKTGKTHQIRSSLAYLGHPIIGDSLYGSDVLMDRFNLHAYFIAFNQYLTGRRIKLEANLPF